MSKIKDLERSSKYIKSPIGKILVETLDTNKSMSLPSASSNNTPKVLPAKRTLFMSQPIKPNLGKSYVHS